MSLWRSHVNNRTQNCKTCTANSDRFCKIKDTIKLWQHPGTLLKDHQDWYFRSHEVCFPHRGISHISVALHCHTILQILRHTQHRALQTTDAWKNEHSTSSFSKKAKRRQACGTMVLTTLSSGGVTVKISRRIPMGLSYYIHRVQSKHIFNDCQASHCTTTATTATTTSLCCQSKTWLRLALIKIPNNTEKCLSKSIQLWICPLTPLRV